VAEGTIPKEKLDNFWTKGNTDYIVHWLILWLDLEEEYVLNWYREAFERHGKTVRLTDMFRVGKVRCDCPNCNGKTIRGKDHRTPRLREVFTPGDYVNFNAIEGEA
jgi:hypothetical protein